MKLANIIFNNFWAKLIALALAIATWFYVFDLVNSDMFSQRRETAEEVFLRYNFIMKELPVKPVFYGKSPEGYRVVYDKVKIEPSKITVFGPEEVLEDVAELETERISLGEYTRSATLRLGLRSDKKGLELKDKVVEVTLPVELITEKKIEEKKPNPAN